MNSHIPKNKSCEEGIQTIFLTSKPQLLKYQALSVFYLKVIYNFENTSKFFLFLRIQEKFNISEIGERSNAELQKFQ